MKKTTIAATFTATALFTLAPAGAAAAAPGELELGSLGNAAGSIQDLTAQQRSVNGFAVIPQDQTTSWEVDGSTFWTRPGEATADLQSFAQWFSDTIEPVSSQAGDETDDWSWNAAEPIPGSPSGAISNHASGTAIDLNATLHPEGERGTFTPEQTALIKAKIASYGGRLDWGGNWDDADVDEMHVEYVANPIGSIVGADSGSLA